MGYAKTPAQADKVLRVAFEAPDDGFDMVKTEDLRINLQILTER